MNRIETVRLEILRSGPAHNQLLSPLTPYIALCAGDGPVTLTIPLEHRQLLNRLERLRYMSRDGVITEPQRQAEIMELGPLLGRVLGEVPGLNAQLVQGTGVSDNRAVHLQLVLWGSELALVPFELVTAPAGFPGSGLPLLTQGDVPVALTREVRRAQPLRVEWDREPRVLFAWAAPAGVAPVPVREHLAALRRAMEPWIPWRATAEDRLSAVQAQLTLLPDANLEDIRRACASTSFTHVHILAHGARIKHAGEDRYGLVLCREGDRSAEEIVEGEALAQALRATSTTGAQQSRPTAVTLATCDSGNVGSTLIPGGGIAHDLHAFGIPWVVASQFPLTMAGSVIVAETWYSRVLRGDDPRWVIQDLRRRLSANGSTYHDWASLIVYAVTPPDFATQIARFRSKQFHREANVLFDKAQQMMDAGLTKYPRERLEAVFRQMRQVLTQWCDEAPAGNTAAERRERAVRFGTSGAAEKRVAELLRRLELGTGESASAATDALRRARDLYAQGFSEDYTEHWVLTQLLSLQTVVPGDPRQALGQDVWTMARVIAEQQAKSRADRNTEAWALATLAEIELLGVSYGAYTARDIPKVVERVKRYCESIVELMGENSFHVFSTRRQFKRYIDWWMGPDRGESEIARAAVEAFPSVQPDPQP